VTRDEFVAVCRELDSNTDAILAYDRAAKNFDGQNGADIKRAEEDLARAEFEHRGVTFFATRHAVALIVPGVVMPRRYEPHTPEEGERIRARFAHFLRTSPPRLAEAIAAGADMRVEGHWGRELAGAMALARAVLAGVESGICDGDDANVADHALRSVMTECRLSAGGKAWL